MKQFTADFETTTDAEDCRVWAYALSNIDDPNEFIYGTSIDEFFGFLREGKENYSVYFHNLKFDGSFILSYLLSHGYKHIEDRKDKADNTFSTLITNRGQFYVIEVFFYVRGHHTKKVKFMDSLKIFPNFSVEKVAAGFSLPLQKLKIDYRKKRPIGHQLTDEEVAYIKNDVTIMSMALKIMFDRGLTKMTIAGDAFESYKSFMPAFRTRYQLLKPEIDADIRLSYRGGFTYVNPIYENKKVGQGVVLDKNSMYPAKMMQCELPYGKPEFFEGEYKKDASHPLFIQNFTCSFKLKKGKIPNIQLKNNLSYIPNEYIETSNGRLETLSLCNPDYELFRKNYEVKNIEFHGGWKFKSCKGMFDNYINYWMERKIQAGKEGNAPERQIAKLMLNSLYGRFGLSPKAIQKAPFMDSDGIVKFYLLPEEVREPVYIPVACFITSYARVDIIKSSERIREYSLNKYGFDAYLYSDTDSIHCLLSDADLEELKDEIWVDDYAIGAWAKESHFDRAIFIRQKCYIEETDGKLNVTVAGLPKYLAPLVTFENFRLGFSTKNLTLKQMIDRASKNGATDDELEKLHHKLTYKYVKGGVILEDTDFTIK